MLAIIGSTTEGILARADAIAKGRGEVGIGTATGRRGHTISSLKLLMPIFGLCGAVVGGMRYLEACTLRINIQHKR